MTSEREDTEERARGAENWSRVGRSAVGHELVGALWEADDAVTDVYEALVFDGEDPTADQIRAARCAINHLQRVFETSVAPIDGEAWAQLPDVPLGVWTDRLETRGSDTDRRGDR